MLLRWFGFNLRVLSFESRMEIKHKSRMIPKDADDDDCHPRMFDNILYKYEYVRKQFLLN
jgi:hypothetical protein